MPPAQQHKSLSTRDLEKRIGPPTSAIRGLRITLTGAAFVVINALVAVAAMNSDANLLFLIVCLDMGVLLFSAAAPVMMVRRIEADRVVPHAAVAGRPFTLVYLVRSGRRWGASWSLIVRETPADRRTADLSWGFIPRLSPGRQVRLELLARCPRRGRLPLSGIRVMSRFPFGLFSCSVDINRPAELIVYPPAARLHIDIARDRGFVAGASPARARSHGGDEEFAGVREFREGDNVRWIHWRRSAHAGDLVVRDNRPIQASQLVILLDPWPGLVAQPGGVKGGIARGFFSRPDAEEGDEEAERLISAAAAAACDAIERGHRVGLVVCAKVPVVLPPAGGRPHRERLLHELALLSPGGCEPLDTFVAGIRWSAGWQARCLLLATDLTDTHRRVEGFLARRARGVIVARPGSEWFETAFGSSAERAPERRVR